TLYIPTKPPVVDTPKIPSTTIVKVDTPSSRPTVIKPSPNPVDKIATIKAIDIPKTQIPYQFPIRLHMPGAAILPYPKLSLPVNEAPNVASNPTIPSTPPKKDSVITSTQ